MPMEYIVPNMHIAIATGMDDEAMLEERVTQLIQLEEFHFIVDFHHRVEKYRQKAWHDHHIKKKHFNKEIWCFYMTTSL